MREIGSGIDQSIRNRNLITENLTFINPLAQPLPVKYDILNGKPLKDWDFLTRMYNAVSPVTLNLEQSAGRQFLFDSGYDLRLSTYYAPDSTDLTDSPRLRSEFQRELGQEGLEVALEKLAKDPKVLASMEQMYADIKAGKRAEFNARDYYHNIMIDRIFRQARRRAWARVTTQAEAIALIEEQREKLKQQRQKKIQTRNILNIPK